MVEISKVQRQRWIFLLFKATRQQIPNVQDAQGVHVYWTKISRAGRKDCVFLWIFLSRHYGSSFRYDDFENGDDDVEYRGG